MKLRQYALFIILALIAGVVGGMVSSWIFMAKSGGAVKGDIEKAKLWLQIAGLAVLIGSVLFLRKQVVLLKNQIAETKEWNRRKATRDMAASFLDEFHKREEKLGRMGVVFSNPDQTYSDFADNDDIRYELKPILEGLEQMAFGIKCDIYDNDIAYGLYCIILPDVYRWAETFISGVREIYADRGSAYSAYVYRELEQLYQVWQASTREERHVKLLAYQSRSQEAL